MTTGMRPRIPFNFQRMDPGSLWVKLAGIGGLTAFMIHGYTEHTSTLSEESKHKIELATSYQIFASILIVALPNTRPYGVPKGLICVGTMLFTGGIYLNKFFDLSGTYISPLGGVLVMLGWGSMLLM